ncbi:hypothetical protein PX554_13855 [Sphingomonas sp. H39-1-10]|uniref:DUF7940 domain-containing protein n=1 Tax=Sphingomonas pollutisoli TaxID=3030829 RepID=UPI0023B9F44E|nr:hypothetical protein [Sphingomonas pollutisoli]MDF0489221.1 hypothetical protein [Sphingomonas pollutisoli]
MLKIDLSRWLIDDAKRWWKLASARLALAGGMIVTAIVANPGVIQQMLDALPPEVRPAVPPIVGVLAAVLPIVVRLWRQAPAEARS